MQLTQAIASVLVAGGARVVSEARLGPAGEVPRPDLAVWITELESLGANPLLIHIYPKLPEKNALIAARNMSRQLRFARLRWGLVMYWEGDPQSIVLGEIETAGVLFLSIRDFLKANQQSSFAEIFAALRNRAIHGLTG
jgi:hypothetical protein